MPRQIGIARAPSEIRWQVFELVGTAYEFDAEFGGEILEIGPAAAGNHDLIRRDRARQAAADDALGHQRGDLDADVEHRPSETELAALPENFFEPRAGKVAGKKEDVLSHAVRAGAVPKPFSGLPKTRRRPRFQTTSVVRCFSDRSRGGKPRPCPWALRSRVRVRYRRRIRSL